ncbi:stage V sporulation T C-terminal domain-containing protein [Sporosarcina saromensis]|uniref:Stage V sporulation T C-terminal domain-containing protein n=1 Tax=Sporosarcina saromensis TaxID=359365 RepID=A0ABU4GA76_9BACL|nr:stage V sporulation T C-terminal domain-containing protein [Sporosarcina saromensis]MDW0113865.1 stage V sporulation T C-terminal domain-containing protein [Sporosarcina saromensis]
MDDSTDCIAPIVAGRDTISAVYLLSKVHFIGKSEQKALETAAHLLEKQTEQCKTAYSYRRNRFGWAVLCDRVHCFISFDQQILKLCSSSRKLRFLFLFCRYL